MRLFKLADDWAGRAANATTLWAILPATGVGVVTGFLSRGVDWINQFGAFGWWTAGITGFLVAALALALLGIGRERLATARAARKWAQQVDGINPLDREFLRKRLELSALVHPIRRSIVGKRFTECELMGPANIVFIGNGVLQGVEFANCDVVIVKDGAQIHNVIILNDCQVVEGEIVNCTIYVDQTMFNRSFRGMGVTPVTHEAPQ